MWYQSDSDLSLSLSFSAITSESPFFLLSCWSYLFFSSSFGDNKYLTFNNDIKPFISNESFSLSSFSLLNTMNASFYQLLDQLSLSTLKYHWQSVLISAMFFTIVYEISRILSPVLFPKTFQFFKGVEYILIQNTYRSLHHFSIMHPIGISMLYLQYIA